MMLCHNTSGGRLAAYVLPCTIAIWIAGSGSALAQPEPPPPQDDPAVTEPAPPDPETQQFPPIEPAPPLGVEETGAFTLTPFLGFGFGGNLENSPLSLGLAAAYNWSPRIGLEGELGHVRRAQQGIPLPFDTGVTTGNFNVLYHFAVEDWAPYATIGVGFGHARAELSPIGLPDESQTEFILNFGGGVKARLAENVNFRAGLRYFNGADLVPDFWRPYAGLTFNLGHVGR